MRLLLSEDPSERGPVQKREATTTDVSSAGLFCSVQPFRV